MPKTLRAPDGVPRLLAPTTTTKLAQRILSASRVAAETLPPGFHVPQSLDVLLALFVAEEEARYPAVDQVAPQGCRSSAVAERWVAALVQEGLVERRADALALTDCGYRLVTTLLGDVYQAQRALD